MSFHFCPCTHSHPPAPPSPALLGPLVRAALASARLHPFPVPYPSLHRLHLPTPPAAPHAASLSPSHWPSPPPTLGTPPEPPALPWGWCASCWSGGSLRQCMTRSAGTECSMSGELQHQLEERKRGRAAAQRGRPNPRDGGNVRTPSSSSPPLRPTPLGLNLPPPPPPAQFFSSALLRMTRHFMTPSSPLNQLVAS